MNLAGCVILYHPEGDVAEKIGKYDDSVEKLYIVDNGGGEEVICRVTEAHHNVVVLTMPGNMGIAYPLNRVLEECQKAGHTHLFVMDQDSVFCDGSLKPYIQAAAKLNWQNILTVAPCPVLGYKNVGQIRLCETRAVMTGGSILQVANALKVGGFNEDYFIDEVDFEFCYRGLLQGFKVGIFQGVYIKYMVGNLQIRRLFGKIIRVLNHSHIRKYYIIRNRYVTYWKYRSIDKQDFYKQYVTGSWEMLLGVLFFEQDKLRKLRYMLYGLMDGIRGRLGFRA